LVPDTASVQPALLHFTVTLCAALVQVTPGISDMLKSAGAVTSIAAWTVPVMMTLSNHGTLLTVSVWGFDGPLLGAGLFTVILLVPAVVRSPAGIVAVNRVELTKVVVLAAPLRYTIAPFINLVPLIVNVKPASLTFFVAGEIFVVTGDGLFTVSVWAFDVPPPGVGLNTVMLLVPAVVRSLAGIVAVSCVELTKVVVLAVPPRRTIDAPFTKPLPLTISVKAVSPTVLLTGEILEVTGDGLGAVKFTLTSI
jgi:hypothetical protein